MCFLIILTVPGLRGQSQMHTPSLYGNVTPPLRAVEVWRSHAGAPEGEQHHS